MLLQDVDVDIDMGEASSLAVKEITLQQLQEERIPMSPTADTEDIQGGTTGPESHEVDKQLVKIALDPSVQINDDDAEYIPPSEMVDPTESCIIY
jgi:hypothetical protein